MSAPSRRTIVAGNWKLNKTIAEGIELATALRRELSDVSECDIIICPVFTALSEVSEAVNETAIQVGAQDLYWEEAGAFTGEVSATLIKDAGAKYVIIGHSERRQFFGDTDSAVNRKAKAALKAGLIPIICCGETLEERQKGQTEAVLDRQIPAAFEGLDRSQVIRCIVAYEPVWAIGTGKVATSTQAQEAHKHIRKIFTRLYDIKIADVLPILYGGSVKPDNAAELIRQIDVDGFLVGGASLKAEDFIKIVRSSQGLKI